jgi:hypothetical protein
MVDRHPRTKSLAHYYLRSSVIEGFTGRRATAEVFGVVGVWIVSS